MLFTDSILQGAPLWYRRPVVQSVALGLVFFAVFAAYTTIQFYAASTYGPELAANSVCAIYASFTVSCVFSPALTNKIGSRRAMLLGILGYAFLVMCSLLYFWNGDSWGALVVFGGVVLGCGAALLWTGQGRLILAYAAVAERSGYGSKGKSGKIMGVFWAVFQCSALVGGAISFVYYNARPEGSTLLYIIFLGFILLGAMATQLLLPPSMLEISNEMTNVEGPRRTDSSPSESERTALIEMESLSPLHDDDASDYTKVSCADSWVEEAKNTMSIFISKPMLLLSVLFLYTGYNQPYQQATFGNRFFTRRTIGVELIIFHLMEIVGAIYCGWALDSIDIPKKDHDEGRREPIHGDDDYNSARSHRRAALRCLALFVAVNTLGNCIAFVKEFKSFEAVTAVDIYNTQSVWPSLAFACWGFADSQIQVYCYWLLGLIFRSGDEHSRAVGYYKCLQSLGVSIGFYLTPTTRVNAMTQLLVSSIVFVLGVLLSLLQLRHLR